MTTTAISPLLVLPNLVRLAEAYGVRLVHVPESTSMQVLNSPAGTVGLDVESRTVFVGPSAKFAHVLHELAHFATLAPGIDYESVPEDFALLQLERCWAQGLHFSKGLVKSVIDWQGGTAVPLLCEERFAMLDEVADYERSAPWRAGFRRLRALDLVDSSNRPTLRRPTWTDETLEELRAAVALAGERRS